MYLDSRAPMDMSSLSSFSVSSFLGTGEALTLYEATLASLVPCTATVSDRWDYWEIHSCEKRFR